MAEVKEVKKIFGIVHPFYSLNPWYDDEPTVRPYSKRESDDLMKRWKAVIDHVASNPEAALVIEPYHVNFSDNMKNMKNNLIDYASKKIEPNRLFINKKKSLEQLPFRASKDSSLFMCGEWLGQCVGESGRELSRHLNVQESNVHFMNDMSVIQSKEYKKSILTPLTVARMKKIEDRHKFFENQNVISRFADMKKGNMRMSQEAQEELDAKRGFSTLPRQKWKKRP